VLLTTVLPVQVTCKLLAAAEHFWGGFCWQHTPSLATSAAEHVYVVHAAVALVVFS
jgi:hypothetical protein